LQPGIALFCFVLAFFFFFFEEIFSLATADLSPTNPTKKPHERSTNGKLNPTKTSNPTKSTNANQK
jgi:hypothetical protein